VATDAEWEALETLVAKARKAELLAMLLGRSGESDPFQKLNLAYSRMKNEAGVVLCLGRYPAIFPGC
jgi:hypothetical protein